jgi:hypothetical protein
MAVPSQDSLEFRVSPNHPQLLAGLDAWVRLGLISDAAMRQLAIARLSCPVPVPQVATPAPTPTATQAPPEPRLPQTVRAFIDELSVIWLLLVGVFLVVVSSVVLAATQWQSVPPVGQYGILLLYTLAFWQLGQWTGRRGNLQATSRMVQVTTLLIIPINFWMMAALGLRHGVLGLGLAAIAALLLSAITVQLIGWRHRWLSSVAVLLGWLHWGWYWPGVSFGLIYGGVALTAGLLRWRSAPRALRGPVVLVFASGLLLGHGWLGAGIPLTQLALAVGLLGWGLLGQSRFVSAESGTGRRARSRRSRRRILQVLGTVGLGLGWLLGLGAWPLQSLGLSGLVLGTLAGPVRKTGSKGQWLLALGVGLHGYGQLWQLIPSDLRSQAIAALAAGWNVPLSAGDLLGLGLLPFCGALVMLTQRLRRSPHPSLAGLTELFGLALLGLGLLPSLWLDGPRSLYLLGFTLILAWGYVQRPRQPRWLGYGIHASALLALMSWVEWLIPAADGHRWGWILLALTAVEWGLVLWGRASQGTGERPSRWAIPRPMISQSWYLGLALAIASYLILQSSLSYRGLMYADSVAIGFTPYRGLPWLLVPILLTALAGGTRDREPSNSRPLSPSTKAPSAAPASSPTEDLPASEDLPNSPSARDPQSLSATSSSSPTGDSVDESGPVPPTAAGHETTPPESLPRRAHPWAAQRTQAAWFGVGAGWLAVGLGATQAPAALASLVVVALCTGLISRLLPNRIVTTVTVGWAIAGIWLALWTYGPESLADWRGWTAMLWGLWLLRAALQRQSGHLRNCYRDSVNGWGIAIAASLLTFATGALLLDLASPVTAPGLMESSRLTAVALTLAAIAFRLWQAPTNLGYLALAWGGEILLLQAWWMSGANPTWLLMGHSALALGTQLLGDWGIRHWQGQRPNPVRRFSWAAIPLAFGTLALALAHTYDFTQTTGLYTGVVGLVGIGIGRRHRRLGLLTYGGVGLLSLGTYELLGYFLAQQSGGDVGDGVILFALLSMAIALLVTLTQRWLQRWWRWSGRSVRWLAHLHWGLAVPQALAALVSGLSPLGEGLWIGNGILLTGYALWQGRRRSAWVYGGVLLLLFTVLYALPDTFVVDWGGAITAGLALVWRGVPWSRWGWSQIPWRRSAWVWPGAISGLGLAISLPASTLLVAAYYGWVALQERRIRLSYLGVGLATIALMQLTASWVIDGLWLPVAIVTLAVLYIAQVDPALQRPNARRQRHWMRSLAVALLCLTTLVEAGSQLGPTLLVALLGLILGGLGLWLRVRAYLYMGTLTFALEVINLLWTFISNQAILLWALGIVVGLGLIWLAATFESRRSQASAWMDDWMTQLDQWE